MLKHTPCKEESMLTVPSPGGSYEKERSGLGAVFLASWFCTHSLRLLLHSLDCHSLLPMHPQV